MPKIIRYILILIAAGVALLLLIQLIPVPHTNPAVVTQVQWDSPQTQELFTRACADCHSNETTWPWYSKVAPISWLVYRDVTEGRQHFNISEMTNISSSRMDRLIREVGQQIDEGEMPPGIYLPMHPTAALTDAEKASLSAGLQITLRNFAASR
jgi:hypothetical protein